MNGNDRERNYTSLSHYLTFPQLSSLEWRCGQGKGKRERDELEEMGLASSHFHISIPSMIPGNPFLSFISVSFPFLFVLSLPMVYLRVFDIKISEMMKVDQDEEGKVMSHSLLSLFLSFSILFFYFVFLIG